MTLSNGDRHADQTEQAAEVCIWLAVACRAGPHEQTISLSSPQLDVVSDRLIVALDSIPVVPGLAPNDQCWFNMVNNPVIANGYPVPKREEPSKQKGLEVSLGLMAALAHADWVTTFDNTLLLKGSISALVPMKEIGESVVWHFLINTGMIL